MEDWNKVYADLTEVNKLMRNIDQRRLSLVNLLKKEV